MTALQKYQRIEATGLWRPTSEVQRREVIVSIGDATLVISDLQDRALAHWSLPAVRRANPGQLPALYHPDGDPEETLELDAGETEMVAAIEKLRSAIERRRPRPGRLRLAVVLGTLLSLGAVATLWLPGALISHTVSVLPEAKRQEIGQKLLRKIEQVAGRRCRNPRSETALNVLASRLQGDHLDLAILRMSLRNTVMLPGQLMLVNAALLEDHEVPDIAAGYLLAEMLRAEARDPMVYLLEESSLLDSVRLLTTGTLPEESLRRHAETLLTTEDTPVPTEPLLLAFRAAGVKSSPYAYALDVSGETSFDLIEADPFPGAAPSSVLSDADWLRLQAICEG